MARASLVSSLVYIAFVGCAAQTAGINKLPFMSAQASSTYADNDNCYGPKFAIDGYSDSSGCNFFHSKATAGYPWFQAVLLTTTVSSVTIKSRCDANGWGHTQFTLVVRCGHDDSTNDGTSLLTQNTLCGSFTGTVAQCSTVPITCNEPIEATVCTVQLYTTGANVHLMFEDLAIAVGQQAEASSSSVYYARYGDFSAYWGPQFAIDSLQSGTWYNFFHSSQEMFPWLQIKLPKVDTISAVTLRSRCDANAWSCSSPGTITVVVRAGLTKIDQTGQWITANTFCGVKTGCDASACMTHTITCPAGIEAEYITVQMLAPTATFLMLDEVTWSGSNARRLYSLV